MTDPLSISNLLSLLQVDPQNRAIKLCIEGESLCRRRAYARAAEVVEHALQMAGSDLGRCEVTLLYRACVRFCAQPAAPDQPLLLHSERAIRSLSLEPHNHLIAQLVHARLAYELGEGNTALNQYYRATDSLRRLIDTSIQQNNRSQLAFYQDTLDQVTGTIDRLVEALAQVPQPTTPQPAPKPVQPEPVAPVEPAQPQPEPQPTRPTPSPLPGLDVPIRLVWPTPDPIGVELMPTIEGDAPDYVEVSRLALNGQPYAIQPVEATAQQAGAIQIQHGQQYMAYALADDGGRYALVRRQPKSDQAQQTIAVTDPSEQRAWIDLSESTAPFPSVRIIGVVEAILTPIAADATPGSTQPAPKTTPKPIRPDAVVIDDNRLNELVEQVDNLQRAETSAPPEIRGGLSAMRTKLQSLLRDWFGLERIPIVPGETLFNPKDGHAAEGSRCDPDKPDEVILEIRREGYTRRGKVFRDARVIVNQK